MNAARGALMVIYEVVRPGSVVRVSVESSRPGWEVEHLDAQGLVTRTRLGDWHRVERALRQLELEYRVPAIGPATEPQRN
jgi:hypothetical protein